MNIQLSRAEWVLVVEALQTCVDEGAPAPFEALRRRIVAATAAPETPLRGEHYVALQSIANWEAARGGKST
jgi:hypothetical protein